MAATPPDRDGRPGEGRRFYTTRQVAQLFGVSVPTVASWADQGRVRCHRTPGGHRRIPSAEVTRLAAEMGVDLYAGPPAAPQRPGTLILVVEAEPDVAELLGDFLRLQSGIDVHTASRAFAAGFLAGALDPDVVVVGYGAPALPGGEVAEIVRERRPETRLVALIDAAAGVATVTAEQLGVDAVLERSADPSALSAQILAMLV